MNISPAAACHRVGSPQLPPTVPTHALSGLTGNSIRVHVNGCLCLCVRPATDRLHLPRDPEEDGLP